MLLHSSNQQTALLFNEVLFFQIYYIDKDFYSDVKLLHQKITSLRDLTKGSILVNYPTEIASRKPFESILNRDEILFVTDICELGVRGIILHPIFFSVLTDL